MANTPKSIPVDIDVTINGKSIDQIAEALAPAFDQAVDSVKQTLEQVVAAFAPLEDETDDEEPAQERSKSAEKAIRLLADPKTQLTPDEYNKVRRDAGAPRHYLVSEVKAWAKKMVDKMDGRDTKASDDDREAALRTIVGTEYGQLHTRPDYRELVRRSGYPGSNQPLVRPFRKWAYGQLERIDKGGPEVKVDESPKLSPLGEVLTKLTEAINTGLEANKKSAKERAIRRLATVTPRDAAGKGINEVDRLRALAGAPEDMRTVEAVGWARGQVANFDKALRLATGESGTTVGNAKSGLTALMNHHGVKGEASVTSEGKVEVDKSLDDLPGGLYVVDTRPDRSESDSTHWSHHIYRHAVYDNKHEGWYAEDRKRVMGTALVALQSYYDRGYLYALAFGKNSKEL